MSVLSEPNKLPYSTDLADLFWTPPGERARRWGGGPGARRGKFFCFEREVRHGVLGARPGAGGAGAHRALSRATLLCIHGSARSRLVVTVNRYGLCLCVMALG